MTVTARYGIGARLGVFLAKVKRTRGCLLPPHRKVINLSGIKFTALLDRGGDIVVRGICAINRTVAGFSPPPPPTTAAQTFPLCPGSAFVHALGWLLGRKMKFNYHLMSTINNLHYLVTRFHLFWGHGKAHLAVALPKKKKKQPPSRRWGKRRNYCTSRAGLFFHSPGRVSHIIS